MSNTTLTSTIVTKETGFEYTNNVRFVSQITKEYNTYFRDNGRAGKPGDTVFARMPVRFEPKSGQALQLQNIYEFSVPVTMDQQFQTAFGWSSAQATLEIDEVRERYINPAINTLANQVDVYAYAKVFKDVWNIVGTPGVVPSAFLTLTTGVSKIVNQAVDDRDLFACLSPLVMATLANANATLFNPASAVSDSYRSGMLESPASGIQRFYREPNVQGYTTGSFTASTPVVNGANQTGSSIITSGWAAGASSLKKGDTFTFASVFTLNPLSYTNTAQLQDFVVTADVNDSAGAMTIPISPSIITTGSLRTVSNSPANGAAITVRGATSAVGGTLAATNTIQNLIAHKSAFTFVTVDLLKPNGNGVECFRSKAAGVSMRYLSGYDMLNDQNPSRLDILGGAASLQVRGSCRVAS
jgi:P22 coat protein - gene protein 5